jgi:hypothetical protein
MAYADVVPIVRVATPHWSTADGEQTLGRTMDSMLDVIERLVNA